jgi:nucleotide-binding universal stress UspA family protein
MTALRRISVVLEDASPDLQALPLASAIAARDGAKVDFMRLNRSGEGALARAVMSYASSADTNLLVLAPTGCTGLSRLRIGAVAAQVTRELGLPVLVVPPFRTATPSPDGFRHAVIALDGSAESEAVFDPVLTLLGPRSQATCTHVTEQGQLTLSASTRRGASARCDQERTGAFAELRAYLDEAADRCRRGGAIARADILGHESPGLAIVDRAIGVDADLIAMAPRRRRSERFVVGSVADRVLSDARTTVLLAPPV